MREIQGESFNDSNSTFRTVASSRQQPLTLLTPNPENPREPHTVEGVRAASAMEGEAGRADVGVDELKQMLMARDAQHR